MAYRQHLFIAHGYGAWKVQDYGAGRLSSAELSLTSQGGRGKGSLWGLL